MFPGNGSWASRRTADATHQPSPGATARRAGPGQHCRRYRRADLANSPGNPPAAQQALVEPATLTSTEGLFDDATGGDRGSGLDRRSASHRAELQRGGGPAATRGRARENRYGCSWSTGWPRRPTCTCTACTSHPNATETTRSSPSNQAARSTMTTNCPRPSFRDVLVPPAPPRHGRRSDLGGLYGAILVDEPEGEIGHTDHSRTRPRHLRHLPERGRQYPTSPRWLA